MQLPSPVALQYHIISKKYGAVLKLDQDDLHK